MAVFQTGDILATTTRDRTRYVRVAYTDPRDVAAGRIYVQDSDAAGFLLNGNGRHLRATTLATRWRLHHSPSKERSA